jgi:hypothetical protein
MHASEQLVERPVELADVTEAEAAQKAAERRRLWQPMTAQKFLGRVGPQKRDIVEALAAGDQRLAQAEDRLCRRVAAAALLHRDETVEQLTDSEPTSQLAHQHEPGMRRQLLRRGGNLDQRRPLCYLHPQECLPVARRDVSQHPC